MSGTTTTKDDTIFTQDNFLKWNEAFRTGVFEYYDKQEGQVLHFA